MRNLAVNACIYEEVVGKAHKTCSFGTPGIGSVPRIGVLRSVGIWSLRGLYPGEAKALVPDVQPVKLALPLGYVDAKHHIEQVALYRRNAKLRTLLGQELLGRKTARFHPAKLVLYLRITFDARIKAFEVSRLCRFGFALIE